MYRIMRPELLGLKGPSNGVTGYIEVSLYKVGMLVII